MAYRPRLNPMQVTLKDVASLAGVSIKTTSRVVNDQGEVSKATRERVKAAIEKLGYRPNKLARSLADGRTKTLAAVVWGIDYYGPSRTIVGAERKANELGNSLSLELLGQPDESDVDNVLDKLIARRVDGVIWAAPEVGENRVRFSRSLLAQLPPIVFLSMKSKPGVAVVAVDNQAGAIQAVQHLYKQGWRKVGLIADPLAWWEARQRYADGRKPQRDSIFRIRLHWWSKAIAPGQLIAASAPCGRCWLRNRASMGFLFAMTRWPWEPCSWPTRFNAGFLRTWLLLVLTISRNRLFSCRLSPPFTNHCLRSVRLPSISYTR